MLSALCNAARGGRLAVAKRFSTNLNTSVRTLNISGVELAAALAVDKSVVRRWMSGRTRPTAVNLARLSAMIASKVPGFSVSDWDLQPAAFARRIAQQGEPARTGPAVAPGPVFRAFAAFADALDREAPVYAGFWMTYVMDTGGAGKFIARAARIWRDGQRMRIQLNGGEFEIHGEVFMGSGNVYILTDAPRSPAVGLTIVTGSPRATPDILVGVSAFNARDIHGSPAAAPIVAEFRGRLSGDDAADEASWIGLIEYAHSISQLQDTSAIPRRILQILDFRVRSPTNASQDQPTLLVSPSLAER